MGHEYVSSVLTINDTPDQLELMRILLSQAGYSVFTAGNGYDGFHAAQCEYPDLVISDVSMPGITGIELCRMIRADAGLSATPILLVSALCRDTDSVIKGLEAGADDYLQAPYDPVHLVAKVTQLTERKRADDALRKSEARYKLMFESNPLPMWVYDIETLAFLDVNEAAVRHYGYSRDEFLGMTIKDIRPPEEVSALLNALTMLTPGLGRAAAWKHRKKDGEIIHVEVSSYSILYDGRRAELILANDITERKRIEDALRQSERDYRGLFKNSHDAIIILNPADETVLEVNKRACEMYGYARSEFVGMSLEGISRDVELGKSRIRQALDSTDSVQFETVQYRKDGTEILLDVKAAIVEYKGGRAILSINRDITKRKRAEEEQAELQAAVQKSAVEWMLTFDAIEHPVVILDTAGRIIKLNQAAVKETNLNGRKDVAGRAIDIISARQPWQKAAEMVSLVRWSNPSKSCQMTDEATGKTWDLTATLVPGPGVGAGRIILVAHDITQMVEMQASLRRGETMSLMGALVAGVAHEVRNPLFAITSTLDAFEARFGAKEEYQRYVDIFRLELERLNSLMQELLEYGKPPAVQFYEGSIETINEQAVRSCRAQAEIAQVKIVNNITKKFAPIRMDRRRVIQVFLNLLENAIHHSPPGATVTLDAEEIYQDGQSWVECIVKDQGSGFRPEDLPRIFEPFFTRRRKGSGLGLSIVQRIVEEHGGNIYAGNRATGGAFVSVRFPLIEADQISGSVTR